MTGVVDQQGVRGRLGDLGDVTRDVLLRVQEGVDARPFEAAVSGIGQQVGQIQQVAADGRHVGQGGILVFGRADQHH